MSYGNNTSSPARLGSIAFDAVMESEENYTSEAPSYATENGYEIGDSIIIKPMEISVSAMFAKCPVTWGHRHGYGSDRVSEAVKELRSLFKSRQLFTYSQNGESYDNMAITSLSIPDKPDEHGTVTVRIGMKQIAVTETRIALVSVAFPRGGSTGTNTGGASTGTAKSGSGASSSTKSKSGASILYGIGSKIGMFG